jgi:hypothetical protein
MAKNNFIAVFLHTPGEPMECILKENIKNKEAEKYKKYLEKAEPMAAPDFSKKIIQVVTFSSIEETAAQAYERTHEYKEIFYLAE